MTHEFRRGLAAIEEAASRKSGGNFSFVPRLRWREDGESKYVLVLTPIEEVATLLLHEWIPVGTGERNDGETYTKWDDFLSRKDPALGEDYDELEERLERDAKQRAMGVVVELEPVWEEVDGRKKVVSLTVATSDYTRKDDDEEVDMTQPNLALVTESGVTLWGAIGAVDQARGPLSDIPIEIIRRGTDKHTQYSVLPIEVPVDLSPVVDHLDGLSYLNDEMEDIIAKIDATDGDMLAAAQVVADALLSKRLNELADGDRYEELVSPLKLEDMPKKFGKGGKKGAKKPAAKKERPARKTAREKKAEPKAEANGSDRNERFAALKARVEGSK